MEHRLTDQPRGVAHEARQVRIDPARSRCGAVTPESPARASRTPPSPPPTKAAGARTEIGLICAVPIMHIELPFCARVGSRYQGAAGPGTAPQEVGGGYLGYLLGYDGSTEKTSQEI